MHLCSTMPHECSGPLIPSLLSISGQLRTALLARTWPTTYPHTYSTHDWLCDPYPLRSTHSSASQGEASLVLLHRVNHTQLLSNFPVWISYDGVIHLAAAIRLQRNLKKERERHNCRGGGGMLKVKSKGQSPLSDLCELLITVFNSAQEASYTNCFCWGHLPKSINQMMLVD